MLVTQTQVAEVRYRAAHSEPCGLPIVIVSAADERFVPHVATMLHSVWTHHPAAEFCLLDCGITPATLGMLRRYADRRVVRLTTITLNTELLRGLPTTQAWSAAIYARLLIPDLLPEHVARVLYLDADCVVVGDLTPFWQMDMGSAALAGVRDRSAQRQAELKVEHYINSGVLLMNLPVWRQHSLTAAMLDYIRAQRPVFPDQTAINAICAGRMLLVPETWNFMLGENRRRLDRWTPPRIIHCTGGMKPWLYRDAFFAALYLHHRNQTPFPLAAPRAVYRSGPRRLLNLAVGRRKYWYQLIMARRCRAFIDAYLLRVRARPMLDPDAEERRDQRIGTMLVVAAGLAASLAAVTLLGGMLG